MRDHDEEGDRPTIKNVTREPRLGGNYPSERVSRFQEASIKWVCRQQIARMLLKRAAIARVAAVADALIEAATDIEGGEL